MKISTKNCLEILRKFSIADELNIPKEIERLEVSNPSPINTLASFRFQLSRYAILFDDTAEDDIQYIEIQLMRSLPGVDGKPIENPLHAGVYGMPYEGKDCYLYVLDTNRQRLDVYLANKYPDYSRSSWQKQIRLGSVTVNGNVVTSPKQYITRESEVEVTMPEIPSHDDRNLPILYIDDSVIVIDKPVDILSHRKNELNDEFTVADFFARFTTDEFDETRPGIVHRLDRDTSGVMIGARTHTSYDHLKDEFANRRAHKTYIAVVQGHLDHTEFMIDLPIARHPSKPGTFRVDGKGKDAQTKVTVLEAGEHFSLVQLEPRTGRTHQLRVHLAHMQHPIVGDRLYGPKADRLYLHAHKLVITTPDGTKHTFESPVPDEFKKLVLSDD